MSFGKNPADTCIRGIAAEALKKLLNEKSIVLESKSLAFQN